MIQDNIIEVLRKASVDALFNTETFSNCWTIWQEKIQSLIGATPTSQTIFDLGDHLSDIFKSTRECANRNQSDLSGGGNCWECLITWYINLCCTGTRVVAFKKKGLIPQPIIDAITVNYSSFKCTSESDITVVIFPSNSDFEISTSKNNFLTEKGEINKYALNSSVESSFDKFGIGIIQCKTNWNDNAQIPMLWDMIYSAGAFRGKNISVGTNGYSICTIPFSYAFVTVPTNKLTLFKDNSVCVKRVQSLSGGNYWGFPSKSGIAQSVKEIFQRNYISGIPGGNIRKVIETIIPHLSDDLKYFHIQPNN